MPPSAVIGAMPFHSHCSYLLPGSPYIPNGNGDGTCTGVHPTGPILYAVHSTPYKDT